MKVRNIIYLLLLTVSYSELSAASRYSNKSSKEGDLRKIDDARFNFFSYSDSDKEDDFVANRGKRATAKPLIDSSIGILPLDVLLDSDGEEIGYIYTSQPSKRGAASRATARSASSVSYDELDDDVRVRVVHAPVRRRKGTVNDLPGTLKMIYAMEVAQGIRDGFNDSFVSLFGPTLKMIKRKLKNAETRKTLTFNYDKMVAYLEEKERQIMQEDNDGDDFGYDSNEDDDD